MDGFSYMESVDYWNTIGCKKSFEDPFDIDQFIKHVDPDHSVVEYGCGYGRLLNILKERGFKNLKGYDYSKSMIQRGYEENPSLDLSLLDEPRKIPAENSSVDAILCSTILCTMVDLSHQKSLINEFQRVLKPSGILYMMDFLITQTPRYLKQYSSLNPKQELFGVYTNSEGLKVRHHSLKYILDLLKDFDLQWLEQYDHVTMNHNPIRAFSLIAKKNT